MDEQDYNLEDLEYERWANPDFSELELKAYNDKMDQEIDGIYVEVKKVVDRRVVSRGKQ